MKKIIPLIFLMFIIISCSTTKYVEVPKVHTEYITNTKLDSIFIHDSIYNHDSVFIIQKGDTVFKYREKIQYKYLVQNKYIDTSKVVERTDTVTVVKPVIQEKEVNRLKWWQKLFMIIGAVTITGILSIIGFKFMKK